MTDVPNRYSAGKTVRVSMVFYNLSDVATDPDIVHLFYLVPGAASQTDLLYGTDAEVVKDSTGHYHSDIVVGQHSGIWSYGWAGYNTGDTDPWASEEFTFVVNPTALTWSLA